MKYDDLVEHLGEFGPYQLRVYCLAVIPAFAVGIQSFLPVFILGQPKHRCAIPGLKNDTYKSQGKWHQQLINYTLPWTDADDDDSTWGSAKCEVYKGRSASDLIGPGPHHPHLHTNATESCHKWVYDKSNFDSTFVTQENLVCDDVELRAHANMIYMCGLLVGSIIFGIVSDNYGRKTAFLSALVVHVISTINLAFASSYVTFVILRFVIGVSNMGAFTCCFVLGVELVGKKYRAQAGIYILFPWCFGMFLLDVVAYYVRDWNILQIIFSSYSILLLLLYFVVPESPRWQISQGQIDKARATLEQAATENQVELPEDAFDSLEHEPEAKAKITDIFRSPILAMRAFVVFINWLVITMVYYGLTLNVGSLGGSVYVNFALSTAVETLGNIVTLKALPRYGRKRFHCFSMLLGGTACLLCLVPAVVGDDSPMWVFMVLSNIGKFGATGGFSTIYIFSAELFPTVLRNTVIGTSSMIARLGGIAAPYVADLGILVGGKFGTALPYMVFGASTLVAGLLALTLPETLNQPTPETIEDAINFGKEKSKSKKQQPSVSFTSEETLKSMEQPESSGYEENLKSMEQPKSSGYEENLKSMEQPSVSFTSEETLKSMEQPESSDHEENLKSMEQPESSGYEENLKSMEQPELSGYRSEEKRKSMEQPESSGYEENLKSMEQPELSGYKSEEKLKSMEQPESSGNEENLKSMEQPESSGNEEKLKSMDQPELSAYAEKLKSMEQPESSGYEENLKSMEQPESSGNEENMKSMEQHELSGYEEKSEAMELQDSSDNEETNF